MALVKTKQENNEEAEDNEGDIIWAIFGVYILDI